MQQKTDLLVNNWKINRPKMCAQTNVFFYPKCPPSCFSEAKAKDLCIPQTVLEGIWCALAFSLIVLLWNLHFSILDKPCVFRLTPMSFCVCVRPNCWRRPWLCWTVRSNAEKMNERELSLRECQSSKCQACLCRIYRYLSRGSESSPQYVTDETSTQWVLRHLLHSRVIVKNSQSN